jgi:hypothetical protein
MNTENMTPQEFWATLSESEQVETVKSLLDETRYPLDQYLKRTFNDSLANGHVFGGEDIFILLLGAKGLNEKTTTTEKPEWLKCFPHEEKVAVEPQEISVEFTDDEFNVIANVLAGSMHQIETLACNDIVANQIEDSESDWFPATVNKKSLVEKCKLLTSYDQFNLCLRVMKLYDHDNLGLYVQYGQLMLNCRG